MIKRLFLVAFVATLGLNACLKADSGCNLTGNPTVASATEIATIQAYLTANGISATQHPSGFFYTINAAGSVGNNPNLCNTVTVRYRGNTFASSAAFDQNNTGAPFSLSRLIVGWQKGIPLIKTGGSIVLFIPPSMGYGSQAVGSIPANSYLKFDIFLDAVN
jgi:FKBP-type peptidyl-prolyl cis-trans isomerase FkpA